MTSKVAVYDIITPDITFGPAAAAAEGIAIFNQCLDLFGDLSQHYQILLSHSSSKCLHTSKDLPFIGFSSPRHRNAECSCRVTGRNSRVDEEH